MIKYSGNTITDWNYGTSNLIKVYRNGAVCYYKVTSGTPPTPPTFEGKWKATYSDSSVTSAECDATSAITQNEITKTNLVEVEIGNCVTSIGNSAFYQYTSLSSVTIPDSVTSIGVAAFSFCNSLTSITTPNSVTSIATNAFYSCYSLKSVTIPNGVIGDNAFRNAWSISSVTIGDGVTSIGGSAFESSNGVITTIDVGSGVTEIKDAAFYGNSGLTSFTITAVSPPTLGTYAFQYWDGMDSVDFPNLVIYVPCESLETYKAASGWSHYSGKIRGIPPCVEPTTYKWKATYAGGTTSSAECDATSAITQNEITKTNLVEVEIGSCVTSIGNQAFRNCTSLTSITIPNSVTSIGQNAFGDCTSLSSVTIPSGVTNINNSAFYGCSGLTSMDIPDSVTSIGNQAFQNCSGLIAITVNATTPPALGDYVFYNTNNCPIYIPCQGYETYISNDGWSEYSSRIQSNVVNSRWTQTTATTCIDGDKYAIDAYEWTCDGTNWNTSSVYTRTGTLIESGSSDCQTAYTSYVFSAPNIIVTSGVVTSTTFEDGGVTFTGASNWRSTGTTTSPQSCRISGGTAFSCTTVGNVDIDNVTFVCNTTRHRTNLDDALSYEFKSVYNQTSSGTCTINGTTRHWIRYKYDESSQSSKVKQIEANQHSGGLVQMINYIGINVADDWQDDLPLPT